VRVGSWILRGGSARLLSALCRHYPQFTTEILPIIPANNNTTAQSEHTFIIVRLFFFLIFIELILILILLIQLVVVIKPFLVFLVQLLIIQFFLVFRSLLQSELDYTADILSVLTASFQVDLG